MHALRKNFANILTLLNLLTGALAILVTLNAVFSLACMLMIFGSIIDVLDGYVARRTKTNSKFGANLDALADLVTFGVAPMLVLSTFYQNPVVAISSILLPLCGAWRLARHNSDTVDQSVYFTGVPIDVAAYLASILVLLNAPTIIVAIAIIVLSVLFVSKIKTKRLLSY